jgi:hypothetical protein
LDVSPRRLVDVYPEFSEERSAFTFRVLQNYSFTIFFTSIGVLGALNPGPTYTSGRIDLPTTSTHCALSVYCVTIISFSITILLYRYVFYLFNDAVSDI